MFLSDLVRDVTWNRNSCFTLKWSISKTEKQCSGRNCSALFKAVLNQPCSASSQVILPAFWQNEFRQKIATNLPNLAGFTMLKGRNRPVTPSKHDVVPSTPVLNHRSQDKNKSPKTSILRALKPNHWSKEVKEVTVVTSQDGVFNFRNDVNKN